MVDSAHSDLAQRGLDLATEASGPMVYEAKGTRPGEVSSLHINSRR